MSGPIVRTRDDAMLGGVCAGIGKHFGIDPTWIRLAFIVVAAATGFFGLFIAYVALWFAIPEEGAPSKPAGERIRDTTDEILGRVKHETSPAGRGAAFWLGGALLIIGIALLLRNLGVRWLSWVRVQELWPVVLILVGGATLWRWLRERR